MGAGPIHVLQVINTARIGGGMGHLYALVRALTPPDFKTTIVATDEGYLTGQLRREGFEFIELDLMRSRFNPAAIWRLKRLIERLDVDLIHLHGTRAGWFGGLAGLLGRRPRSIYTVHGFSYNKEMSPVGRAFYNAVERMLARMNDRLISVSETDREDAVRRGLCPAEKIITIHNGVDLQRFNPESLNGCRAALRGRWGCANGAPLVGTVARLVPQKGIEDFLEAARLVLERRPDARFVVVGEGELLPRLENRAQGLGLNGELRFAGACDDVPGALSALDVFVLSSLWEGHPLSLLEALAMQRPSVATRTSGTPEIINDRQNGLLVPPKDPQALAEAILYLLDNPAEAAAMGEAGRRGVAGRFGQDTMVQRTLQIYRELAAGVQ